MSIKKLPRLTKHAVVRILISIWIIRYIYSLFWAPALFVFWGSAYLIGYNNEKLTITTIATNLKKPEPIKIRWFPFFIKDDSHIYSVLSCPNTPATGFDVPSFEWVGRGSGWVGMIVKDKNGIYITSGKDWTYGRIDENQCPDGNTSPYRKIQ